MVTAHWEDWVDQKIPALEGKTPREAVKTSDGRESVEALLIHAERQLPPDDPMTEVNRSAIKEVRRKLGLS
ncbi:MAG: MbcA/ParS/Xre antitoxin family protein [Desulfobacterales bacterium]|nr:MbcA/ParS/Xre antitoxin family protein [Desulfobacterales bacterium]